MEKMKQELVSAFREKRGKVGVVGLGYVGLPLAMEFAAAGFDVVGVDLNEEKIRKLKDGHSYVEDVPSQQVAKWIGNKRFYATTSFKELQGADAISICVPTPLRKTKDPDLSYIIGALDGVTPVLHSKMLIVLESTTYPGTTRELFAPRLEKLGLKPGKDVFVAFSPERVDPGNKKFQTRNTPKVVGGLTPDCTELAAALYANAVDTVVSVGSSEEAEMVKLLENTFRAVNIALVNEMLLMCDRMGIDIWNVVRAASTKPFGFMPFYPGPGIGGHCIPLDPAYLSWKAKTYDFYNRFIELASDVNGNMPRFVIQKSATVLNKKKKALNGARVLVLGAAYKANVSDVRESPALEVIRLLEETGAEVSYWDPYVPTLHEEGLKLESRELSTMKPEEFDLAILVTNHEKMDRAQALRVTQQLLDCRNFFSPDPKVTRL